MVVNSSQCIHMYTLLTTTQTEVGAYSLGQRSYIYPVVELRYVGGLCASPPCELAHGPHWDTYIMIIIEGAKIYFFVSVGAHALTKLLFFSSKTCMMRSYRHRAISIFVWYRRKSGSVHDELIRYRLVVCNHRDVNLHLLRSSRYNTQVNELIGSRQEGISDNTCVPRSDVVRSETLLQGPFERKVPGQRTSLREAIKCCKQRHMCDLHFKQDVIIKTLTK